MTGKYTVSHKNTHSLFVTTLVANVDRFLSFNIENLYSPSNGGETKIITTQLEKREKGYEIDLTSY